MGRTGLPNSKQLQIPPLLAVLAHRNDKGFREFPLESVAELRSAGSFGCVRLTPHCAQDDIG